MACHLLRFAQWIQNVISPTGVQLDSAPASSTASICDVGNDNSDVLQNVSNRNDELPYPQLDYPGGETQLPNLQVHDEAFITATTLCLNVLP